MTRSASAGAPRPVRVTGSDADAVDESPSADDGLVGVVLAGGWVRPAPKAAPELEAAPDELPPEVLRRAVGGDNRAFATMVEHYDPMLCELTFHLLGERAAMDDVLQATYVRAYRALPRLSAGAVAGPWLYRIAYQACIDELQRRYRHPARIERPPEAPSSSDEPPGSAFGRTFSRLPADQRAAVILADRAGLGIDTIAAVLGLAEPAATKALGRGRAALQAALDHDSEPVQQAEGQLLEPAPQQDIDVR